MSHEGSITRWIAELELGHASEAQEQLWQRYFRRLVGLAKAKLGETPRGVADEEDVAIAALNSFFGGHTRGQFPALHNRNELWPLLAKITAHKALDQQRYLLAEKRGGGKVCGDPVVPGASDTGADWQAALIEDELSPESLVVMNDECVRLMAALPDDQLRTIARMRLEGYKNVEIAQELQVIERTVERRLQLIRTLWAQELGDH